MTTRCFLSLVIKALGIKRKLKLYAAEKEFSKAGHESEEVNRCLGTQFSESFNTLYALALGLRGLVNVTGFKLRNEISILHCLSAPRNVKPGFFHRFFVEDSMENFIIKSVLGFLGGILLTYVCFMFLVFSLNFTLKRATYICIGLGVILPLGLAFSVKIRCTVFLCIPQLFSKRGRQALLAYAFILALSGPAKNTLHNVEVMSESLACTQEQLKQAENDLLKCVQKPNAAAKKTIEKLLEKINTAVKDFKNFILQLYKNCFDILETVLHAQKWLYSITLLCHKKMGKPAHRCLNLLAETKENCEEMFSSTPWRDQCEISPFGQELICSSNARFVCTRGDVPESLPVSRLQKQLTAFKHRAMNILYVSIEAHQTYSQTNRSYTYHEEYQGMATEIRQKTDQFLQYFDFMSVIFGIFILVLFVKVIIYRHKFLTEDHYDNRYITSDFVDIDNTRAAFRMETLLPLAPRERLQYIKVTSVRLVPCERVRLLSSFVFLIFATFKIIIHMLTDSSLYWILSTVRRNERLLYMSTLREEEPVITVRVVGDGLVAELFRNVTGAVKRESSLVRLDPTPCLPDPVPPDWNRYYQILALVLICWLLAVCEPYGLRLRHSVMVTYHPDRARERAIWLYNRIISNRISFVKVSRRRLRRQYKDVWLKDTFRYKFMREGSWTKCLLCKTSIRSPENCVRCPSPECVGIYCAACFQSLEFCNICADPTEYGDLSDLSEEKDSSEEECTKRRPRRVNFKGKTKEDEILLNLKKTDIKLKDTTSSSMTQKSNSESLIQPTLLYCALRYCRSKMPSFRKLKTLSDFESSDWDHDSSMTTEGSGVDEREAKSKGSPGKREKGKGKGRRAKKKEEVDERGDHKSRSAEKSEQVVPKVCLFKKVSPVPSVCPPEFREMQQKQSEGNAAAMQPELCIGSYRSDEVTNVVPNRLLQVKDSMEVSKLKSQKDILFPEHHTKCDSGVLVNDEVMESEIGKAKFHARFFTQGPPPRIIVDPLRYSKRKKKSPRKLRFIDPTNIHEIDLGTDSDEEQPFFGNATCDLYSGGDAGGKVDKGRSSPTPRAAFTPSHTRVCYRSAESSESTDDSVKICVREENLNSSSESECQFYYRPFRSRENQVRPESRDSSLKRASGKLNLKTHRYCASYSVETDSSNDNFLSVKPSRRVCSQNEHETVSFSFG